MLGVLILGATVVLAPIQDRDTSFAVSSGDVLRIRNDRGSIVVGTWNQDRVAIEADFDDRGSLSARRRGSEILVRARQRRGNDDIDIVVRVPPWMRLDLEGVFADIEVTDSEGEVRINTTHGDIRLEGGRGFVELSSSNGDIQVSNVQGRIRVETLNGEITVRRMTGQLWVETVNGDVEIDRAAANGLEISTINGDVSYDGSLSPAGDYTFSTHNGDVTLMLDPDISAEFTISTAQGEFETECPVRTTGTRSGGRQFSFEVGTGAAHIGMESFGGTLSLRSRGACW